MAGLFIVLEGGEGCGKSTIADYLFKRLSSNGYRVLLTREPGGVKISEQIRNIILDNNNKEMDPMTEALLYAASRRQHLIEKVIPELESNGIVICDRFIDSSLAYQGYARGLGIDNIMKLNSFAIQDPKSSNKYFPDLSIFLDIDPIKGLDRVKSRGEKLNRLDKEKLGFHYLVREGYNKIIQTNNYIIKIDASEELSVVEEKVYNKVLELITSKGLQIN